jgi:DNA-binding NarL/FixJ family response regulator
MNEVALDPRLKVVAEVAKDLGRTERRIQQMIASGDLPARKATDLEEFALRRAGRLSSMPPSTLPASRTPPYPDGLTRREVEVLRLVALGWSDAQVAAQLVISPRTVNGHLRSIYTKINVNSRSAATRYAIEHALIT